MATDLEIFKCLYLCSLTFYGLITGLAEFSFNEWCYWYLQSALNPCLKATPLLVEKLNFPDFLLLFHLSFFLLSSFFIKMSYPCPIRASWVSFFTVLQRLGRGCAMTGSKEDISWWCTHGCDSVWLCGLMPFKILLTWCKWIQLSIVAMLCCKFLIFCTKKEHHIKS